MGLSTHRTLEAGVPGRLRNETRGRRATARSSWTLRIPGATSTWCLAGGQRQRQLSWADQVYLGALSDDGQHVVFSTYSGGFATFIESTDGDLPLKLGPGYALALSHDMRWVVARPDEYHDALALLPVGAGAPKNLAFPGLDVAGVRWLQDDKHLVFAARPAGEKQFTLYTVGSEGGDPKRISQTPVHKYYFEVSQDGQFVAATGLDEMVTVLPLAGGPPVALPELGKGMVPAGWSAQGELWVRSLGIPCRLLRYDILSRRTLEERDIAPSDATGVSRVPRIYLTPDGRTVAFDYERTLGYLYVLQGLAPPRW